MKNGWDFDNAIVVLTLDSHKILRLRILNTQILSLRNYILVFNDIIQVINAYISTRFLWDTNILFLDISKWYENPSIWRINLYRSIIRMNKKKEQSK